MENAEQGLPVRPLIGTTLLADASDAAPAANPAAPPQPAADSGRKPDTFEKILNGIFGGT